jgi:hypothetical protein
MEDTTRKILPTYDGEQKIDVLLMIAPQSLIRLNYSRDYRPFHSGWFVC